MINDVPILAASDPTGQIIGVVVVAVIWVIGLIVQAAKKTSEQAQKRRPVDLNEEIRRRLPTVDNRPTRDPRKRPDWEGIAQKPQQRQKPPKKRPAPPPIPVPLEEIPATPIVQQASATALQQPERAKPRFIDAQSLGRWLKPSTLQQQFILTELLQRPMCDRDDPAR